MSLDPARSEKPGGFSERNTPVKRQLSMFPDLVPEEDEPLILKTAGNRIQIRSGWRLLGNRRGNVCWHRIKAVNGYSTHVAECGFKGHAIVTTSEWMLPCTVCLASEDDPED